MGIKATDKAEKQPGKESQAKAKDRIQSLIGASDEIAVGALLEVYRFQTIDEKNSMNTIHQNNIGFGGVDGAILSSMSEFYLTKGFLTPKQLSFVKRSIKKYWRQLIGADIKPMPLKGSGFKAEPPKKFERVIKSARLDDKNIIIKISYPKGDRRFFECVQSVKTLSGRRFVKTKQQWVVPLSIESVEKLQAMGFTFDKK